MGRYFNLRSIVFEPQNHKNIKDIICEAMKGEDEPFMAHDKPFIFKLRNLIFLVILFLIKLFWLPDTSAFGIIISLAAFAVLAYMLIEAAVFFLNHFNEASKTKGIKAITLNLLVLLAVVSILVLL